MQQSKQARTMIEAVRKLVKTGALAYKQLPEHRLELRCGERSATVSLDDGSWQYGEVTGSGFFGMARYLGLDEQQALKAWSDAASVTR